jgi:hypothetical protein
MTASAACLALVALAGGVAEAEEPAQPDIAPNFTLPNAQDGLTRVKWPRDKAVFLTFGEQASQTAIQAWSKRMRKTYGDRMEYYGVAWLDEIPANLLPTAKTVIKTTHPDVLMDTSGSCADRYKCRRGKVNAFVIAPSGEILKRIHEPMNDKLVAQVDGLLEPFTKESNQKTDQSEGDKS